MSMTAMFLASTFSTPIGTSSVNATRYTNASATKVMPTKFTSNDSFADFPMDEIKASMQTADIVIPSQLATADEIDAWLMDL